MISPESIAAAFLLRVIVNADNGPESIMPDLVEYILRASAIDLDFVADVELCPVMFYNSNRHWVSTSHASRLGWPVTVCLALIYCP